MTNEELTAVASLVDADRWMMEAANMQTERVGLPLAYDDSVDWPARDALEVELEARGLLGNNR